MPTLYGKGTSYSIIVVLSGHLTAVIDGVIYDTHGPSRGGTRCVYGYYSKPGRTKRKETTDGW
jgi:hypothetical protein